MSTEPCPEKTRADLEWDRVLDALAERCAGELGRLAAHALDFADTFEEARRRQDEVREALLALNMSSPLPVPSTDNVTEPLERLRAGGVLSGPELRAVAQMLLGARTLRRFLVGKKATYPNLFDSCSTDPSLDPVAEEVARCFDPDGSLADHASPRLKELRGEWRAARERMMRRLEELLARYSDIVQDHFVTEREGRYVLPIRSDAHQRFPGIVHSTSGSGGTVFVEPRVVVGMGNRLKMLEADVAREEQVVLTRLSASLAEVLSSIIACVQALARADVRAASAKLARDFDLTLPALDRAPRLELFGARHLLLVLDMPKNTVVPSDLAIESGRTIVVSGPNAGGKTVALKAMGLAALLVRAGLPVPCKEGSTAGYFEVVLTDVGDDQSLAKNLSTFSAHVKNLTHVLEETRPGALVLLDEIATGTDPCEGEALAAGVLDSLCARGGAVMATTHYEGLKALALVDDRFTNASVGFDLATMTPNFALTVGVPGSSSALAVARRFGMPTTVLERAARFLSNEDKTFEEVVRRANDERAALELARTAAETRLREVEALKRVLEDELVRAREREHAIVSKEAESLLASVRRAREDLRAAQAKLRVKTPDEDSVREASRALDRVASTVAIGGELESLVARPEVLRGAVAPGDLKRGLRVYVSKLRAEAEVLDVMGSEVRVAAGAMKLTVSIHELRRTETEPAPRKMRRPDLKSTSLEVPIQTSDNTCDVRGMRVDDALSMVTSFLDRGVTLGRTVTFVIHGHGTGALRDALRKELESSPYVSRIRPGESGEGGDGVTIAWLN